MPCMAPDIPSNDTNTCHAADSPRHTTLDKSDKSSSSAGGGGMAGLVSSATAGNRSSMSAVVGLTAGLANASKQHNNGRSPYLLTLEVLQVEIDLTIDHVECSSFFKQDLASHLIFHHLCLCSSFMIYFGVSYL